MIQLDRSCWPARCAPALLACTLLGAGTCTYARAPIDQALAQSGGQERPPNSNEPGSAAGGNWNRPEPAGGANASGSAGTGATSDTGVMMGSSQGSAVAHSAEQAAAEAQESAEAAKKAADEAKEQAAEAKRARIRAERARRDAVKSNQPTMQEKSQMKQEQK